MKKIYLIILFVSLVITNVFGLVNDDPKLKIKKIFVDANAYYQEGEFQKAIDGYRQMLNEGYVSGNLYYNLGNAYFKENKLSEAILSYERSKIFNPRDADLEANYMFARDMIKGRVVSKKNIWHWKPLRGYANYFTINELTLICSGVFMVLLFLVFLGDGIKGFARYKRFFVFVITIFLFLNCFIIYHRGNIIKKTAIVTMPNTEVFYGPYDIATKFFILQEGMKVLVLESQNGWSKIRRIDGKIGWIKTSQIERIL